MIFITGMITGLLLLGFLLIITSLYRTPIERTYRQVEGKLSKKGSIIEPPDADLEGWINDLKSE